MRSFELSAVLGAAAVCFLGCQQPQKPTRDPIKEPSEPAKVTESSGAPKVDESVAGTEEAKPDDLPSSDAGATTRKPLKVYILAGQSNMQGHALVRTLDHVAMDPKMAPMLKEIRAKDGTPLVHENVWITALGAGNSDDEEKHGKLGVGYGAGNRGPKIGPELTFGIYMQKHVGEPILVIKTAWGGKSLHTDFRSPSAGPYELNDWQRERYTKEGKDLAKWEADKAKVTGHYYRLMVSHVKKVLGDIKRVMPAYDPVQGYELAGFVWFQGWNDMGDSHTYPNRGALGSYDKYTEFMAAFIRDVRRDLSAPDMPFVVGVMGNTGPVSQWVPAQKRYTKIHGEFRFAQAKTAELPEFKGNVTAVRTEHLFDLELNRLWGRWEQRKSMERKLRRDKTLSDAQKKARLEAYTDEQFTPEELKTYRAGTSNFEFHYLGSGKFFVRAGKAFADAIAEMSESK